MKPSKLTLATLYGAGLSPKAPGTVGSAVATLLAYPILMLTDGVWWLLAGVVVFTLLGTRSATAYMRDQQCAHDPGEVVVDELAGQWLTYGVFVAVATFFPHVPASIVHSPFTLFLGFLCFRVFDITKPWPISLADARVHGGFGVMFDDLLAAIPAGLLLYGLVWQLLPTVG